MNKLKKIFRKLFPKKIMSQLIYLRKKQILNELINYEKNRFLSSAYSMNDEYTFDNLRSKITFHYHSIEKGLSNPNLRYGFGKKAFTELFWAMDEYLKHSFSTDDSRFQQAISVIESYIDIHQNSEVDIDYVLKKFDHYKKYYKIEYQNSGGFEEYTFDSNTDFSGMDFEGLSRGRYSVRDFGEKSINMQDIIDSVQIATKTPSVCNRQSTKVHLIEDEILIQQVIKIQNGFTSNGENLQKLLLVTASKEYMNGPHERNQTYIDGGLFLMSLVYALTSKNIATCILNADFYLYQEKELRSLLDLNKSEDLIAFVAMGSFNSKYKVAKSPRDDAEDIIVKH